MICQYFLPLHRLSFHFVDGFLCYAEAYVTPLVFLAFVVFAFGVKSKISLPISVSRSLPLMSLSRSFMVSGLTFRSSIHFELILVYGIREWFNFILLHVAVWFSQHHLLKRLSFPYCTTWFIYHKLIDHICVGLLLALYPVPLIYVSVFCANTIQFRLL